MVLTTRLHLSILAICICFAFITCGHSDDTSSQDIADTTAANVQSVDSVTIELVGEDSTNVLDLLLATHDVEYKSSAMGAFVTAIDSVEQGGGAYWTFTVNDTMPPVACDKMVTRAGDRVVWHLRK